MSILSGYGKFKRYLLTDEGYKLLSQWTSSNTLHFDDGNTAQTKVGAINGITDSLTSNNSNIALSSAAGKNLQDQVTSLNTDLSTKISNTDPRLSDARTPKAHTHDDRYYTETEVTNLLNTVFKPRTIPSGYDVNSIAAPAHNGIYWLGGSGAGVFGYSYCYMLSFSISNGDALQVAFPYASSGLKYRMRVNGGWSNIVSVT